jgi:hypothetical protein
MMFVNVDRGRRDGIALAKALEEIEEAEALEASVHFVERTIGNEVDGPITLVDEERDNSAR